MKAQKSVVTMVLVAASLLFVAGPVAGQGVGNLGSLPTSFQTGTPPNGWTVISTAGPIPVVLDPLGPVWGKSFTGPNGSNFLYPPTSPSNPALPVTEVLQVAGTIPWTDWHEDVIGIDASGAIDLGWTWGANPTILVGGLPAPGLSITGAGTSSLSFFFNSLAPGTVVDIRKDLVYTGPAGAAFIGTLAIHEYPTPEPASLALLAIGSLLAFRRFR